MMKIFKILFFFSLLFGVYSFSQEVSQSEFINKKNAEISKRLNKISMDSKVFSTKENLIQVAYLQENLGILEKYYELNAHRPKTSYLNFIKKRNQISAKLKKMGIEKLMMTDDDWVRPAMHCSKLSKDLEALYQKKDMDLNKKWEPSKQLYAEFLYHLDLARDNDTNGNGSYYDYVKETIDESEIRAKKYYKFINATMN